MMQTQKEWHIPPDKLLLLTQKRKMRLAWEIFQSWGLIILCVYLGERYRTHTFFWYLYPCCVIGIGSQLHALGVMAHDGAHGLLAKTGQHNDRLVAWLLAWPVFLSFEAYRSMHHRHHRYLNTLKDPDWARNRPDLIEHIGSSWNWLRGLLGLSRRQIAILDMIRRKPQPKQTPKPLSLIRIIPYVLLLTITILLGKTEALFLYWLVPFLCWFLPTMRLKGVAEHFMTNQSSLLTASRTIRPGFVVRQFVAPKNVHYHLEHHLYPTVPFYNLRRLHDLLITNEAYKQKAYVVDSYGSFLYQSWKKAIS